MIRSCFLSFFALFLSTTAVLAQEWPAKPVRVIVGYPAGGGHGILRRRAGFERQTRGVLTPELLGAQKIGAALDPFDADGRGSVDHLPLGLGGQADSFLRPCARRRARIKRPFLVDMRLRNPCRRLRTILLGW